MFKKSLGGGSSQSPLRTGRDNPKIRVSLLRFCTVSSHVLKFGMLDIEAEEIVKPSPPPFLIVLKGACMTMCCYVFLHLN